MRRREFVAGLAACGGALALGAPARADEVSDVLAEITRARASLKTLLAPFTQERTIGLLATAVKSEGEMTMVLPDRLRWELKPPDAVTYWITPEGFGFATPRGGANAGKGAAGRFGAVLSDLLILLGGDLERLRGRYDLSVPSRKDGIVLAARPKAEDVAKHVKSLELAAGPELWTVRRVVIEEQNGDRSVITFGAVTRDAKVDPERMKPPKQG
ncbi:MAG: outer membrane lipoprotein carrier protein LolA [Polyangiaceae bacterium]|nr:outer membrane lipoprotein carrier protein LolA [Polyangiaceae bacterium]